MRKSVLVSIFILFSFVLADSALCQLVKFKLGPSIGLTLPTADYSGTTIDYYYGTRYGLSQGFSFGGLLKAGIGRISIRASGIYSQLSNSGNSEPGKGFVEVKHGLFTISVGPEFGFGIPMSPVKPYAGIDFLFTSMSGTTTFRGVSKVPSDVTFSMQSTSRIGLGFGGGVEIGLGLGGKYALDLNFRYNLINLMGKKFEDINPGDDKRLDSYLSLNDERDPLLNPDKDKHFIANARSISTIQFNVSFLFGF